MYDFFKYEKLTENDVLFHKLTFLEWIIPLSIFYMVVMLIIIYRRNISDSRLKTVISFSLGGTLGLLFTVHYVLLIIQNDVMIEQLPLSLMAINSILAIILSFTGSKKIFSFLIYSAVIGSIVTLIFNTPGYSYQYFKYYNSMIIYGITALIPLYYLIVYEYVPTFKDTIKAIITLQIIGVVIFIFNYIFDTEYMSLVSGNQENSIATIFGGWPFYLISYELIAISSIFILLGVIKYLVLISENNRQSIPIQSHYMNKKKESFFSK
ncbi:YwaF family protein [Haloplasma contractile]|uniref:Integral membrane protein n=1 Tax=Haloplasma contractile SSD-17B TaxID=1033810 RepID=U2DSX1_9MOLU|nr:YwaF family protein [Haloplasma contractile]ERJ11592.1 Integral membrane protein [Haloplasma contractile SSD-17B]